MTLRLMIAASLAVSAAACFTPGGEVSCKAASDCAAGYACVDLKCRLVDGDAGAGGGAGALGGGSGATGGGTASGGGAGGSGGGSATGGGMGADAGRPDAGTCNCTSVLGCQPGDSPLACGSGGGTCALCGVGQQCVNGVCQAGTCGPQSCAGCCTNNFCVTPSTQSGLACGTAGAACTNCMMGQTCTNGACVTAVCDLTSCATGCCSQGGRCITMQNRFACGTAAQMCMQCPMGQQCTLGVCTPGPAFDGGTSTIGGPCTVGGQCQPQAFCVPETNFGQASGYPGGLCTARCGAQMACPSGVCISEPVFGVPVSTCRESCPVPGSQGTCRAGYVCTATPGAASGWCRPRCTNGGASQCTSGSCDAGSGFCQ